MAQQVLEGTWEEISRHAAELAGRKLRVIVVDERPGDVASGAPAQDRTRRKLLHGMFPELRAITDEDLKSAEWRGEDEAGL